MNDKKLEEAAESQGKEFDEWCECTGAIPTQYYMNEGRLFPIDAFKAGAEFERKRALELLRNGNFEDEFDMADWLEKELKK